MTVLGPDGFVAGGQRRLTAALIIALLLAGGFAAHGQASTTSQSSGTQASSARSSKGGATWQLAGYVEQSGQDCSPSVVQHYLDQGASPNAHRPQDVPALFVAASNGATACALLLLKHGASFVVQAPDGIWLDALFEAVGAPHCDASLAKALIKAGNDPNYSPGPGSMTALAQAASEENVDCAKVLLEHGANVNATDYDHYNALLDAQFGKRLDGRDREPMTKLLLNYGADPNLRGPHGMTALFFAMAKLKFKGEAGPCVACISLLIAAGADPNLIADDGYTPLLLALRPKSDTSIAALTVLLAGGANVNLANAKTGETPLMAAAAQGSSAIVDLLLNNGANRCASDKSNRLASAYARQNGHPDLAQAVACQKNE